MSHLNRTFVHPISLDLGAKTTGVYAAFYPEQTVLEAETSITKKAFIAEALDPKNKGYQLLQNGRTQKRHALRNNTRKRQAKRLIALIMQKSFGFDSKKHDLALRSLINRRGYSYLDSSLKGDSINEMDESAFYAWLEEVSVIDQHGLLSSLTLENLYEEIRQEIANNVDVLDVFLKAYANVAEKDKKSTRKLKALKDYLEFYKKDLSSGAKSRRVYIENIHHDLLKFSSSPDKHLRKLYHALKAAPTIDGTPFFDVFHSVLCHVNNFDLKLLNRILSKVNESSPADVVESVLAQEISQWIIKKWALSKSNGAKRIEEIKALQSKLKAFCNANPNKIIKFLIDTSAVETIPPYEANTNKRPPECQTLILNHEYLNQQYPCWRSWLKQLANEPTLSKTIEEYSLSLRNVKSGKNNTLIHDNEVESRTLQLIMDLSQESCPFGLNKIWSQIKKANQLARQDEPTTLTTEKLDALLSESSLRNELKAEINHADKKGSFWHFVNKYYQTRRKARAGRLFFRYDRSISSRYKWQRDGQLFIICSHRPKQLKHQSITDIATTLGFKLDELNAALNDKSIDDHFGAFRGLKTLCKKAYDAQKKYGAELKEVARTDKELIKLIEKLDAMTVEMANSFCANDERKARYITRNNSIFTYAQLYNFVWGDRSGFGKTCPICSNDNSFRMTSFKDGSLSSRLNTLSMRLIDGALKRLLTHQAHHIANRLWPDMKTLLETSKSVSVPIIVEKNAFDFTENLDILKGKSRSKDKNNFGLGFESKKERIRNAGNSICPYTGALIENSDGGDVDHIIPRTSSYGVLNDEANLIFSTEIGNRKVKGNRELLLDDLAKNYLEKLFGTSDTLKIKDWIHKEIYDATTGNFNFGQYKQFPLLSASQQKAFRHALFLKKDDKLRQLVISSISHRSKAKVNGTQRYFAQLLSDALCQKAETIGAAHKLSFDYFEVSSNPQDELSTTALRRYLQPLTEGKPYDFSKFEKLKGQSQASYSHIIDASVAFMLALYQHHNEGSVRITLPENTSLWGSVDENGEITLPLIDQLFVHPDNIEDTVEVKPKSLLSKIESLASNDKVTLDSLFSRTLFKENAIGLHFNVIHVDGDVAYKGYTVKNAETGEIEFSPSTGKAIKNTGPLKLANEQGLYRERKLSDNKSIFIPNKDAILTFLFNVSSSVKLDVSLDKKIASIFNWFFKSDGRLYDYTASHDLKAAPKVIKNPRIASFNPLWIQHYNEWLKLHPDTKVDNEQWVIKPEQMKDWDSHCKRVLGIPSSGFKHKKVKNFTMKALTTLSGTPVLAKRKNHDGSDIFQLLVIDTTVLAKDKLGLFVKKSKRLALFSEDVLKNGYSYTLDERPKMSGMKLSISDFFNENVLCEAGLLNNDINITILSGTEVAITGFNSSAFAEHFIMPGLSETSKKWSEMSNLELSDSAKDVATIDKSKLYAALVKKPRSDMPIGVLCGENDSLSLKLRYKKTDVFKV